MTTTVEDCELCIVGAGYAGLNGLNAAAKYLKKGDRVVFVDKGETWGGQWNVQYDYVRLHQPYRMFTAGDQKWALTADPSHLATRREVLEHLASVPAVSAGHLEVKAHFGYEYVGHEVRDGRVHLRATCPDRPPVHLRARRLLLGKGFDVSPLPPFRLSSNRVRTVAPADPVLMSPEFLSDSRPVYIIGAGKTAMDTALHVLRHSPRRKVQVIIGQGMWYLHREHMYPRGLATYWTGRTANDLFLDVALGYDGTNERGVFDALARAGYAHSVYSDAGNCRNGMLSVGERETIRRGTAGPIRGYLVDVDGLTMAVRSGREMRALPVEEGSWFINCTTHFPDRGHSAVLSDSGLVCAPQFVLGFSGNSAYFVTHLWYLNKLDQVASQLYRAEIDIEPRLRFVPHLAVMLMANIALMGPHLPFRVTSRYEGDFNKWYPLVRQLPSVLRMNAWRDEILRKAERVVRVRFSDSNGALYGSRTSQEMIDAI